MGWKAVAAIVIGLVIGGLFVWQVSPVIVPRAGVEEQSVYQSTDEYDGGVMLKARFLDDQMHPVMDLGFTPMIDDQLKIWSLRIMSVLDRGQSLKLIDNATGEAIRYAQVTVIWETIDIQPGMDVNQYEFLANLSLTVYGDSGVEQWSFPYDLDPAGTPDIQSSVLNDTAQWTLDLKIDVGLEDDAKTHGSVEPTFYTLTFTLEWQAKMWDTEGFWEYQYDDDSGGPLSAVLVCKWIQRGFKTVPRWG